MDYPIKSAAIKHLSSTDPMLGRLIKLSGTVNRTLENDAFTALTSTIVAQQLSASAADSIWARLQILVGEMTPENIAPLEEPALRACGLSSQKIKY